MIHLRMLGALELIDSSGREIDDFLTQPKRVALLIYLVLAKGLARRDTLVSYLWPDLDHYHARHALRQAVYCLRSRLGEGIILTRGLEEVGVSPGGLLCDATELEAAYENGNMRRVMRLYRGELLPGFHVSKVTSEFEHWLDGERFRLRIKAQEAAGRLAAAREEEGNHVKAARWIRRWLTLDPTDEQALIRLMSLLDRSGNRAAALAEFESFRQRLAGEWGIEPSGEALTAVAELRAAREQRIRTKERRHLPRRESSFVGRQGEIEGIVRLLRSDNVRLVTLAGVGGSGKSRLAQEVARRIEAEYPDGVCFIPLGSTRNVEEIARRFASALGIRRTGSQTLSEQVQERFRDVEALVFVDDFEPVVDALSWIVDLLRWSRVDLLVTCRVPLRIAGEHEYRAQPLSLPVSNGPLVSGPPDSEAVELFVDRARAVDRHFRLTEENVRAVIEICRRLDGLPLAIELAAARMNVLPVQEIAERLERPYDLLTRGPRGVPKRQRTLEAAVRWTCDLLTPKERELFYGLSVFRGGFGIDAVEGVWSAQFRMSALDTLASLLDANLVQREDQGMKKARFTLLVTLRQYGAIKLEKSNRVESWRKCHARHFAQWVMNGRSLYCTADEEAWLRRLDRDHENLCAALDWSIESQDAETAGTLASSLWWYWWTRGYSATGLRWLRRVLHEAGDMSSTLRARCVMGLGALASAQGDQEQAVASAKFSVELMREGGGTQDVTCALQNLGFACREHGDLASSEAAFREALDIAEGTGDDLRAAVSLFSLGCIAHASGDYPAAVRLLGESRSLSEESGNQGRVARALLQLGRVAIEMEDLDEGERLIEDGRAIFESLGDKPGLGQSLEHLGEIAGLRGQDAAAAALRTRALEIYFDIDYRIGFVRTVLIFVESALHQGRVEEAARMIGGLEKEIRRGAQGDAGFLPLESNYRTIATGLDLRSTSAWIKAGRMMSRERLFALATGKTQALEPLAASG